MKVFLSHAQKDHELARQLAARLTRGGFTVWDAETEIEPGENYAKKIGKALDESEAMVFLLTPGGFDSEFVRKELDYALDGKKFKNRVFTVFVGPSPKAGKAVPWILLKLPYRQVESARQFGEVVRDIRSRFAPANLSQANA